MKITPNTTLSELLRAGFTVTSPDHFELRGVPDDHDLVMRTMTPAGMTAAGHHILGDWGIHMACGEVNDYAEMCIREDASK